MRISDWSSDVCSSDLIKTAEAFFAAVPARVSHGGDRAFYAPGTDRIQLPPFPAFHDAHGYYATRAHETVHWTRQKSRLDCRFGRAKWGDDGYARAVLVALSGQSAPSATLQDGRRWPPRTDR